MNLAIDVGNTLIKLGVFNDGNLTQKTTCSKNDFSLAIQEISKVFPIKNCIISAVSNLLEGQFEEVRNQFEVLLLNHQTPVSFVNKYATPLTLGIDRIALVSAAADQFPQKNVLIIDAGTCITYDFINSKNEYFGGAISPGISLRYKALHTFTEKLPLLKTKSPDSYLGNDTASAIHSGVVNGILYEIEGYINEYKKDYDNLTVILTGGDAHFLRDSLKNDIFANSNFLLEGLNHILEYNKH
ncbi:type III pantothenate kinase [Aequorivita sp. SDUM287046]|uniref:Type III pantothenate kinase n=1 Tax=Aequorivita aurantiaca TaxID=3053356 RepID=A0ABT8DHG8_9FLAO|nr:type III pantothenate kinase [Aequorivita aurantiaca]MDN3724845.1 type III pantothenate kinase [Aequorivita aurantiaca]